MASPVADEPEVLQALLADSSATSSLWKPTSYWRNYTGRINDEIRRVGLSGFQSNSTICKGFATGGVPEPVGPVGGWKRGFWRMSIGMPVFSRVVYEYRRTIAAEHRHRRRAEINFARIVLDMIAEQNPDLRVPQGIANGKPDDAFEWQNHEVTASWVAQLARIVDFYTAVPPQSVETIMELGPGLGLSTLAHRALNPYLKTVVNVDIVPIIYVSTQYLKSTGEFEVADYQAVRNATHISVGAGTDRPKLYQLPPWLLPRLTGRADYFFNAFSFQEMEKDICANYAQTVIPLLSRGVVLHSMITGHALGAGGQREPVTLDFLIALFASKFPARRSLQGIATKYYGLAPGAAVLLESKHKDTPGYQ